MHSRRTKVIQALGATFFLTTACIAAIAQSIPASSADSGRRAVVAVDQSNIYNNINNANNNAINAANVATWAVDLSNNAQNTANTAINIGNAAVNIGNTAQDGVNRLTNAAPAGGIVKGGSMSDGSYEYQMICVAGFPPANPAGLCPAGSGAIVFSKNQVGNSGGSAGGGGSN